jgi:hypothetical protein
MSKDLMIYTEEDFKNKIYTLRGVQVMLDSDLADFYMVETKYLNKSVKRNIGRFPVDFMFQLSDQELKELNLRFHFGTSSLKHGGRRTLPYVFTEQGVAMLSAVLKSDIAVKISVRIMQAFVSMRKFIASNAEVFNRLDRLEIKQIETDKNINAVLNALESKEVRPRQAVFYDGKIFDAYKLAADIIRSAQKSIVIIDNYIDDNVLTLLTKRKKGVLTTILTKKVSKQMMLDVKKYNEQDPIINIKQFNNSHDRFIIIDRKILYHFGASLKDLGKKWFAFSRMDIEATEMLANLKNF